MGLRETKKIILPKSKIECEIVEYFTVLDRREIRKQLLKGGDLGKQDRGIKLNYEGLLDYQDELVKRGLITFDGKTEKVFDRLMQIKDMADYEFLVRELEKLNKDEEADKKK